jgi:ubiquinone/menaquinone biosynthesis C-methylase UbiE
MRLLDVGSRTSIFPLFIAHRDAVEMHATDLDPLVEALPALADRIPGTPRGKLIVKQADLRKLPYPDNHFDRITNISVIEHVPDPGDIEGMKDLARVLKPGGKLILTTPFSATARDFHLNETVYSEEFKGEPVFFQRHYTDETVRTRLIEPTGLREVHRAYFGEAGYPFFNKWWVLPGPLKALKALYAWRAPAISGKYMDIFDSAAPLTLQSPPMITANGIFLILTKDA